MKSSLNQVEEEYAKFDLRTLLCGWTMMKPNQERTIPTYT